MTTDLIQFALYCAAVLAIAVPLGAYMARIYAGVPGPLAALERPLFRLAGIDPEKGQAWAAYALSLLAFNAAGFVLLFGILKFQDLLPFNPQQLPGLPGHLAFNAAISFVTNTNWQSYGGETTMSYFSQMAGLTTQNFVSAATGMAVAAAVARGLAGRQTRVIGNFWVDMTRSTLYILLPIAIILTLVLVWQGVPQTNAANIVATTLEGGQQTIAVGPVASQIAIKQLGTNGGGFFNVNSAHPFENPTAIANFLEMVSILAISAGFCFTFGRMVGDRRQGRALFAAMGVLFVVGFAGIYASERVPSPLHAPYVTAEQGNMEGKEVRFGVGNSAIWTEATTAASNGSVNRSEEHTSELQSQR